MTDREPATGEQRLNEIRAWFMSTVAVRWAWYSDGQMLAVRDATLAVAAGAPVAVLHEAITAQRVSSSQRGHMADDCLRVIREAVPPAPEQETGQ